jgi:hypothetical protein
MTEKDLAWYDRVLAEGDDRVHPSLVVALLAEVRRLRELVEQAFFEAGSLNGPGVNAWEWENSDARKEMEGA